MGSQQGWLADISGIDLVPLRARFRQPVGGTRNLAAIGEAAHSERHRRCIRFWRKLPKKPLTRISNYLAIRLLKRLILLTKIAALHVRLTQIGCVVTRRRAGGSATRQSLITISFFSARRYFPKERNPIRCGNSNLVSLLTGLVIDDASGILLIVWLNKSVCPEPKLVHTWPLWRPFCY